MKKHGKHKPKTHKAPQPRQAGGGAVRVGGTRLDIEIARKPMPAVARLSKATSGPARAIGLAPAYEADERHALALLLLPFLIVAMALGLSQTLKPIGGLLDIARPRIPTIEPLKPVGSIALAPLSMPTSIPAALRPPIAIALTTPLALPLAAPSVVVAVIVPPAPISVPLEAPSQLAALNVPTPPIMLPMAPPAISPPTALPAAPETLACLPAPKRAALTTPPPPAEFGAKLAAAAQAQTADFVIYSAAYKRIAYPMGDVPSLYGTCSDLVIRAYRALGVDLQDLVQRGRVGRGDPNIDHRRTDTLRAFFTKYGQSFPPSTFGEDYKPGDIVTYYRPYSRVSRAHIAVVSDIIGPSGRPMIVHNRGWGPQIEDALFVDRLTGHYRFAGAPQLLIPPGRMVDGAAREPNVASRLPLPKAATARTGERVGQLR